MGIKYFLVGGYVRDLLLNKKPGDVDLAVEADSYESMKQNLLDSGVKIFLESPQYYTICGSHKDFKVVDYILCHKNGNYTNSHRPNIGTIYDDLARRDFTINSISICQETQEYLDPHNGRVDLIRKLIRTVGDPDKKFEEDHLRILRALRFSIKYQFTIDPNTYDAMKYHAPGVLNLPMDRVRGELYKIFSHDTVKAIYMLEELKLLSIFNKSNSKLWLMPTNKDL